MYSNNRELNDLYSIALSHNDIHALTEAASRLLKNPIAVYDTSYYILAYSSLDGIEDEIWIEGMNRGFCRIEYAAKLSKLMYSENNGQATQIIDDFGSVRRRQDMLTIDSNTVGYIAILENNAVFEEIPEDFYRIAISLLAKEVSILSNSINNSPQISVPSILNALLNNRFANKSLFYHSIKETHIEQDTTFMLIAVDMLTFKADSDRTQLRSAFSSYYKNAWFVFHEHYILILFDMDKQEKQGDLFPEVFINHLKKTNLRCCASDPFTDLYLLKYYFNLCKNALELSELYKDTRPITLLNDYKLLRSISLLDHNDIAGLCQQVVVDIYNKDIEEHSENLKTLFYYLHSNRSLQKTSEYMFIHKNTVAYRIKKIGEHYNLDFENAYESYSVYYSCLLMQSLHPDLGLLPFS